MNLKERLQQIKQLEAVNTPWEVRRIFGKIELLGSQVSVAGNDMNDYVELQDFRTALEWLVEQSGGTVKWSKAEKGEKK